MMMGIVLFEADDTDTSYMGLYVPNPYWPRVSLIITTKFPLSFHLFETNEQKFILYGGLILSAHFIVDTEKYEFSSTYRV